MVKTASRATRTASLGFETTLWKAADALRGHNLSDAEVARIADTYHAWRGDDGAYADVPGFCKAATLDEIRAHGHVLTPGRYVGAAPAEEDGEPFEATARRLIATLREQTAEARALDQAIARNLKEFEREL